MTYHPSLVLVLLLMLIATPLHAQERPSADPAPPDTLQFTLDPITVYATPFNLTTEAAPFALSTLSRSDVDLNRNPALSLERLTYTLPGVQVSSREHYALGERITMRGLGWRAQFGVRGIQVIMDGIPLTMADGQSVLNAVDPAFIRDVEVIRGPSSTFWGNSSGGVLYLSTLPEEGASLVRVRQMVGAYGLVKTEAQVTSEIGPHRVSAYGSYLSQDGYRAHSDVQLVRTGLNSRFQLDEGRSLRVFGAYANMPEAQSPGSITGEAVAANPRQARDAFVSTGSGKTSEQGQLGASYQDERSFGTVRATAYGLFRELENPLPFAYITLDRAAGGVRATLQNDRRRLHWGVGVEGKIQRDDRVEFNNADGTPGDQVQTDQLESVDNGAVFARASLPMGRARVSAGLRYDRLRFEADNRLNGAGSGGRTLEALSPSVGVTLDLDATRLFANVSTALEAPTTTELSNRPDTRGGFNPNVGPEHIVGAEAGAQGWLDLQGTALSYDVALFGLRVNDLLVPFQNESDETFYRNAGRTRHLGVETALRWQLPYDLRLQSSYTLTRATFIEAETEGGSADLDGNRIPGVPMHVWGGALQWEPDDFLWTTVEVRAASRYPVNNQNTAENDGYAVFSARATHPGFSVSRGLSVQPFVAVNNVLDAHYNSAVVVNAFGGRYYEPAAGRHWQAGVTLQID